MCWTSKYPPIRRSAPTSLIVYKVVEEYKKALLGDRRIALVECIINRILKTDAKRMEYNIPIHNSTIKLFHFI